MSELTLCNFCNLRALKSRTGKNEVLSHSTHNGPLGGVDYFRHPKEVSRAQAMKERDKYFVAWFMEITDHCVC